METTTRQYETAKTIIANCEVALRRQLTRGEMVDLLCDNLTPAVSTADARLMATQYRIEMNRY